ncbi:hypothetical protein ACDX78_01680 [Virgibacillus oceani]
MPLVADTESINISAASLENLVAQFDEEGAFSDEEAVRALQLHLTAIGHYEYQGEAEKVVRHMDGFQVLIDYQLNEELISHEAYGSLQVQAEVLADHWE